MSATGIEFAKAAIAVAKKGYTYQQMDCQAFVEASLAKVGIKKNWRGSNHMWREALSWKGTVEECREAFGEVPVGAWLFTIKNDGGEKARGYTDNLGNAAHVGVYTGEGRGSVHSTNGGTQEADFPSSRWTHVGLCSLLDYEKDYIPSPQESVKDGLIQIINIVESLLNGYFA